MADVAIQGGKVIIEHVYAGQAIIGAVAKLDQDCCCPCACQLPLPEGTAVRVTASIVLPDSAVMGSCLEGTWVWDEFQLDWDANSQHYFKCAQRFINQSMTSVSVTLYCLNGEFRSKAVFFAGPCNGNSTCTIGDTNFTELGPGFLAEAVHDSHVVGGACLPKSKTGTLSGFGATLSWTVWT